MLTPRWYKLIKHDKQQEYFISSIRFIIAHSGRRSGKTEIAKRKALRFAFENGGKRVVFGAPTHQQAIKIFWDDIVAMIPKWMLKRPESRSISLSNRSIDLVNGTRIEVAGLDKPERIEGPPLDYFIGDEYGNFKASAWTQNIRPALSTIGRSGRAILLGVPEGKNHYFELTEDAKGKEDWKVFTWHTSEINPEEAERAKGDVDTLTYSQEYEGAFVSFQGLAYYAFDKELNCPPDGTRIMYNPSRKLIFCHDFNRVPGTCAIAQEIPQPDWLRKRNQGKDRGLVTAVIDEVYFRHDSTTEKVCDELIRRWGHHKGGVDIHGDATGGAKVSSAVDGSDYDIIRDKLNPHFKIRECWPKGNPPVRVRINAMNSRLRSADGFVSCIVDRKACPMLIRDLEAVTCDDAGDIEKNKDSMLTHISDGFGYYIAEEYPCGGGAKMSFGEV